MVYTEIYKNLKKNLIVFLAVIIGSRIKLSASITFPELSYNFSRASRNFPRASRNFPRMFMHIISASMKPIIVFLLTVVTISTLNWISIQFMATYCATWSLLGLIKNLINLGSPVCTYVNHVQVALADYYITIWTAAAGSTITWIAVRLSIIPVKITKKTR